MAPAGSELSCTERFCVNDDLTRFSLVPQTECADLFKRCADLRGLILQITSYLKSYLQWRITSTEQASVLWESGWKWKRGSCSPRYFIRVGGLPSKIKRPKTEMFQRVWRWLCTWMVRRVFWQKFDEISEVRAASIVRAFITTFLKMEAVSTIETLVIFYQNTRRDIPKDNLLQNGCLTQHSVVAVVWFPSCADRRQ